MAPKVLSILIPAYNEAKTIQTVLKKVTAVELPAGVTKRIVVIDDGSTDDTGKLVRQFQADNPGIDLLFLQNETNVGKGASLRQGLEQASGDFIVFQDADLEYNPDDLPQLLAPILADKADVVYGSRFKNIDRKERFRAYYLINSFLTKLSNMVTGFGLSDMESCYKMFTRSVADRLELAEDRFGIEPEITAKIARIPGIRVREVPISYDRRGYFEGKKLRLRDGLRAVYCVFRYRFRP